MMLKWFFEWLYYLPCSAILTHDLPPLDNLVGSLVVFKCLLVNYVTDKGQHHNGLETIIQHPFWNVFFSQLVKKSSIQITQRPSHVPKLIRVQLGKALRLFNDQLYKDLLRQVHGLFHFQISLKLLNTLVRLNQAFPSMNLIRSSYLNPYFKFQVCSRIV